MVQDSSREKYSRNLFLYPLPEKLPLRMIHRSVRLHVFFSANIIRLSFQFLDTLRLNIPIPFIANTLHLETERESC